MNRNRLAVAAILFGVLLHAPAAVAATYYIDSRGGDGRSDGRAEATPWKSHTMAQKAALHPGDIVMFKRGSRFSGPVQITESGMPGKPILLTAYGEGEAPRFTNPDDRNLNGNCILIGYCWTDLGAWQLENPTGKNWVKHIRSLPADAPRPEGTPQIPQNLEG